jgi:transcriptional regulator
VQESDKALCRVNSCRLPGASEANICPIVIGQYNRQSKSTAARQSQTAGPLFALRPQLLAGHNRPMYQPPQFKSVDPDIAAQLMRAHPFASLISNDDAGLPFVTHLPLHLEQRDGSFVLLGHCAKPNPHWGYLEQRPAAVVTFLGPHAYMSPKLYPDLARVPSWTYLAVHCTVSATVVHDPAAKDQLLKKLIGDHEPAYAEQWRGLGQEFAQKMLAGIVAFELAVLDLQCKLKLNQHRPESHGKLKAAYAQGNDNERDLAQWMDRLGLGNPAQAKGTI